MNILQKVGTKKIAQGLRKGYMQLLINRTKQLASSIDNYFFVEGDEESEEVRPYFYGSIFFSIAVVLFVYVVII